jgi:hypothetical protein
MGANRGGGGGSPFMGGGQQQNATPKLIATVPITRGGGGVGGQNPFLAQQQGPGLQAMPQGGGGGGGWGGWGSPPNPFSRMPQWGGGNPFSQAMGMGMPPNRHPGWMQQEDIRQQSAGGLKAPGGAQRQPWGWPGQGQAQGFQWPGEKRGSQGGPGQFPSRLRSRFDTDFGSGRLQGL